MAEHLVKLLRRSPVEAFHHLFGRDGRASELIHEPVSAVEFALELLHGDLIPRFSGFLDAILQAPGVVLELGEHLFRLLTVDRKRHLCSGRVVCHIRNRPLDGELWFIDYDSLIMANIGTPRCRRKDAETPFQSHIPGVGAGQEQGRREGFGKERPGCAIVMGGLPTGSCRNRVKKRKISHIKAFSRGPCCKNIGFVVG